MSYIDHLYLVSWFIQGRDYKAMNNSHQTSDNEVSNTFWKEIKSKPKQA